MMSCEVLMVIMSLGVGGGASLMSDCAPSVQVCEDRAKEYRDSRQFSGAWQCVEVGALVDQGRRK